MIRSYLGLYEISSKHSHYLYYYAKRCSKYSTMGGGEDLFNLYTNCVVWVLL